MEEENKKITKVVISKDDELTDIITSIVDSQNERIVLTFAEDSDLLISPINLKVILETADEQEKLLIAQIIKNSTGVRNANSAGITAVETTTLPTEDIWEEEIEKRAERLSPKKEQPEKKMKQEKIEDSAKSMIMIDQDIPSPTGQQTEEKTPDFSTKDFSSVEEKKDTSEKPSRGLVVKQEGKKEWWKKNKKFFIMGGIGLILMTFLIAFIYYKTAPFVRIRIYVESKEASVEKIFTGDENIKEIDFETEKIPIKTETVEKASSSNVRATGKSYKGEKAKGNVSIFYLNVEDCSKSVTLPAGHTLTSEAGKIFRTEESVTVSCAEQLKTVKVVASDIGEEYNLSTTSFSVQNYAVTDIKGTSTQPFTGGMKEEYTVLTAGDVNTAVEDLKKISFAEGEQELKDKSGGSWKIIEDSIKSELDKDSIKTSAKVGEEASDVSLEIKIKSTATFYMREGFEKKIADLLTQEAEAKNLFETDKDLTLTLSQDVKTDVNVVESTPASTKIKLSAKGSVQPKIEKETVVDALKGKKWEDGMSVLKGFVFSEKETEVVFEPKNFPEKLKYFPAKHGGINVEFTKVL